MISAVSGSANDAGLYGGEKTAPAAVFTSMLNGASEMPAGNYEAVKKLARRFNLRLNNSSSGKIDFDRLAFYSFKKPIEDRNARSYAYGAPEIGDRNGAPLSISTTARTKPKDLESFLKAYQNQIKNDKTFRFKSFYSETHGGFSAGKIEFVDREVSILPIGAVKEPELPLYLYTSHLILDGCFTYANMSKQDVADLIALSQEHKLRIDGNTTTSSLQWGFDEYGYEFTSGAGPYGGGSGGNAFAIYDGKVAKILRKGDHKNYNSTRTDPELRKWIKPKIYNAALIEAWKASNKPVIDDQHAPNVIKFQWGKQRLTHDLSK